MFVLYLNKVYRRSIFAGNYYFREGSILPFKIKMGFKHISIIAEQDEIDKWIFTA
jgi:hypothetical protein